MKYLYFLTLITFINANSNSQSVCYVGNLKFGNESCLSNFVKDIPMDVIERKSFCEEITCMPYLKKFEAHICFQQKANEMKFIILHKDMKKEAYDISLFQENESYMLKQVAISGTNPSNSHITIRLVSGTSAYRVAFNSKNLGVKNVNIPLQKLGTNNLVIWQPYIDYDRYFVINNEDKSVEESFVEFHSNTSAKNPPTSDGRRGSKSITNEEMCLEWSSVIPEQKLTISSLPTSTVNPISQGANSTTTTICLIIAAIFIAIILCCGTAILIPVICCLNQKRKTSNLNDIIVQREANVVLVEAHPQIPEEIRPQLIVEPPLLPLPPSLPQLPQSLLTPPPSYQTNESVQVFHQLFLDFMHYMNNFGTRNSNNIPRSRDIVEMEALTRPSQNDLAFE